MTRSKLATMVAILATAAGFSALAGPAHAQISGSIGGDYLVNPAPGFAAINPLTPVTISLKD